MIGLLVPKYPSLTTGSGLVTVRAGNSAAFMKVPIRHAMLFEGQSERSSGKFAVKVCAGGETAVGAGGGCPVSGTTNVPRSRTSRRAAPAICEIGIWTWQGGRTAAFMTFGWRGCFTGKSTGNCTGSLTGTGTGFCWRPPQRREVTLLLLRN